MQEALGEPHGQRRVARALVIPLLRGDLVKGKWRKPSCPAGGQPARPRQHRGVEFQPAADAGRQRPALGNVRSPATSAAMLATDEAAWITGQTINTEGGFRRFN
jgi:hypothetical protein